MSEISSGEANAETEQKPQEPTPAASKSTKSIGQEVFRTFLITIATGLATALVTAVLHGAPLKWIGALTRPDIPLVVTQDKPLAGRNQAIDPTLHEYCDPIDGNDATVIGCTVISQEAAGHVCAAHIERDSKGGSYCRADGCNAVTDKKDQQWIMTLACARKS